MLIYRAGNSWNGSHHKTTQTLKVVSSLSSLKKIERCLCREKRKKEGHEMPLLLPAFSNHPRFLPSSVCDYGPCDWNVPWYIPNPEALEREDSPACFSPCHVPAYTSFKDLIWTQRTWKFVIPVLNLRHWGWPGKGVVLPADAPRVEHLQVIG